LFTQLKTLPWAQIPIGHQTREAGHGRRETRTVKAITLHTPGGIGFPHAEQAIRITRTRTITKSGKTTRETAYLTISLPATDAHPSDIQRWIRAEWLIENLVHHVRDVTFREDLHQARTGTAPPSWPPCVTPRSASTGPAATPTSPVPPDAPTAALTI
jgi:hypothetical protein